MIVLCMCCPQVLVIHRPENSEDDKERRAREQRGLSIRDRGDGSSQISGRVTDTDAALIRACLDPLAAPRPQLDGSRDPRSADVRRLDAMLEALSYGMRHGYTGIDDIPTDGDDDGDDLGDDDEGDDDDEDGLGFDLDTLFTPHPDQANDNDSDNDSDNAGDATDTGGGPDGGGGSDSGSDMDGLDTVAASGGHPPAPAGHTTSSPTTPTAAVTGGSSRKGAARGAGGQKTDARSSIAGLFRGGPNLLVLCDLDALTRHDNRSDVRIITGPQTISHIPLSWASFERMRSCAAWKCTMQGAVVRVAPVIPFLVQKGRGR